MVVLNGMSRSHRCVEALHRLPLRGGKEDALIHARGAGLDVARRMSASPCAS